MCGKIIRRRLTSDASLLFLWSDAMRVNEQIDNARRIICVSRDLIRWMKQATARNARRQSKRDPENAALSRRYKYSGWLA